MKDDESRIRSKIFKD